MSDNIPFEIQEEVIKRLPVESLIQFRSVCKAWKSLIDSSRFVKHYSSQQQQQQYLFVRYTDSVSFEPIYVSVLDDDTLPRQTFFLTHPRLVNMFLNYQIIGCSHGLLCFHGYCGAHYMAVLWNISIIKSVNVVVPNVPDDEIYDSILSFGVCLETTDPKIVKITYLNCWSTIESVPDSIPSQVEVFALSTRAWRNPYSSILPSKSIEFSGQQALVDGFCYCLATDWSKSIEFDGVIEDYKLIISFHMTREEFGEVNLPSHMVYGFGSIEDLCISNLRESLVVLEHYEDDNEFHVWLMEDAASKSFTMLYTIYTPEATILSVLEFTKSGEPIIEIAYIDDDTLDDPSSLVVYEPKLKQFSSLGFDRIGSSYVHSYMETLLLLDQP